MPHECTFSAGKAVCSFGMECGTAMAWPVALLWHGTWHYHSMALLWHECGTTTAGHYQIDGLFDKQ
eukprot:1161132-Pelagomonas_calceolata.AAC.2